VRLDGLLIGNYGVNPRFLTADTHKITVTEMRGHTLTLVSQ